MGKGKSWIYYWLENSKKWKNTLENVKKNKIKKIDTKKLLNDWKQIYAEWKKLYEKGKEQYEKGKKTYEKVKQSKSKKTTTKLASKVSAVKKIAKKK